MHGALRKAFQLTSGISVKNRTCRVFSLTIVSRLSDQSLKDRIGGDTGFVVKSFRQWRRSAMKRFHFLKYILLSLGILVAPSITSAQDVADEVEDLHARVEALEQQNQQLRRAIAENQGDQEEYYPTAN